MLKSNQKRNIQEPEGDALRELEEFIESNPDPRELKRALAVRILIEGLSRTQIQIVLGVSIPFISKWKVNFALGGVEALRLGYRGSVGYLNPEEREEIIEWLKNQKSWNLLELENYIEDNYNVFFKSKQSYYDLFKEAGISWKKSQKKNPKRDDELVKNKHKEIYDILESNRDDIEAGRLVVYIIDECHLLWGDVCGYVWGKTQERIEIPIINERERQTYYGAINYATKQFIKQEYEVANSENTVSFLKYLLSLNPESRHLIIWDGASYHRYKEMKDYLREINQELEASEWPLRCVLLAPNAPEQNPVEDIWLNAKNWLRRCWYELRSFSLIKWFFSFIIERQFYDFPKLHKYGFFELKLEGLSA
ncbi:IS630 family transposase [Synechococcus sp. PCC 7336]|uniref:IS630 family transposase n=1 Tax=Synechococcus sp. PCC 7336 TaxID=195250 RepID=UPI00034B94FC|nr:IS630 family transposase [Synechococcus sp. PCC 7336]